MDIAILTLISRIVTLTACGLVLAAAHALCFVSFNQAIFFAAVVLVAAAPATLEEKEEADEKRPILILLDKRTPPEGATYAFAIETENGISFSEVGVPGSNGQSNMQGVYR